MALLSQPYVTTEKTIALTIQTFVGRVMSLILNTLSRFAIAFLPRSNHLLISCVQSPSTVILEPKNRKWSWMQWSYLLMFSFKLALSLSSFTLIKRLFSSSSLSAIRVVSFTYEIVVSQLMFFPPIYFYLPCIPSWYFKILFLLFLFCLENFFSYCF